jgi:hypothetical protein
MTHEPIRKTLAAYQSACILSDARRLALDNFYGECNPEAIAALLADLDRATAEVQEQARLNGMGSEREAALLAQVDRVTRERDASLRALRLAKDALTNSTVLDHERDWPLHRIATESVDAALGAEGV